MKTVFIYSLSTLEEPDNIKYIGKTLNCINRLKQHLSKYSLKKTNKKSKWIFSELNKNHNIIITVIDVVPENEWQFWEQYWICQFKVWGYNLTNKTPGGDI